VRAAAVEREGRTGARNELKGKARTGRVALDDLVMFTRQLAVMFNAGLPLLQALSILEEEANDNPNLKKIVAMVSEDVEGGESFSAALERHKTYDDLYCSMVRAGETGGNLDEILNRLAEYMEATASLRRKIKSAMTYPVIAASMVSAIAIFLVVFIIPQFAKIFDELEVDLPAPTAILIALSDAIRANALPIVAGLVVSIVLIRLAGSKTAIGRRILDMLKLKMPVFGPLFRKVNISRFSRTFATLQKSGVPILLGLDIVADTCGNVIISDAVRGARSAIQEGESLAVPLAESRVFPAMVTRMIAVGEQVGAMEAMLTKIADFYDEQVEATVESLTSLIEPLLIGFLGVVVGGIVLAMFMPLFSILGALQ